MPGLFTREMIEEKYVSLDYKKGWTFMMSNEETLLRAKVAFVGLNPGGGGKSDNFDYAGNWDVQAGNAYFVNAGARTIHIPQFKSRWWSGIISSNLNPFKVFVRNLSRFDRQVGESYQRRNTHLPSPGSFGDGSCRYRLQLCL